MAGRLTSSLVIAVGLAHRLNAELAVQGAPAPTRHTEAGNALALRALRLELGRRFDILERAIAGQGPGQNRVEVRIGGLT